jgi:hypothetical protein
MPSINIHAHCVDHDTVLALLEQVAYNAISYHYSVDGDLAADEESDARQEGYEATARKLGDLVSSTPDSDEDPREPEVHEWSELRDEPEFTWDDHTHNAYEAMLAFARMLSDEQRALFVSVTDGLARDAWGSRS